MFLFSFLFINSFESFQFVGVCVGLVDHRVVFLYILLVLWFCSVEYLWVCFEVYSFVVLDLQVCFTLF